jgi:hypothetical protein
VRVTRALITVLLLVAPHGAGAQDEATASAHRPLRPAEYVAAQVRSVLRSGGSPQALGELAKLLPELASAGIADAESTLRAARIAEELSGARVAEGPIEARAGADVLLGRLDQVDLFRALAIVIGTLLLWGVVRRTLHTRTPKRAVSAPAGPTPLRFSEARALVSTGAPLHEISRRTGMARDAIHVLAGLQRR